MIKEIFDNITYEEIANWVEDKKEETVYLDFKCVDNSSMGKSDRKNLVKALSGFANSEGGMLIWGVDAREGESGADCAQEIFGVENIERFLSKLNEFTSEVSPFINGVEHKKLVSSKDGKCIAVTYVPESDVGPHMAKATLYQYFKRAGDKFLKMEHYDVADMFGRRRKARLEVTVSRVVRPRRSFDDYLITLTNTGRGSAVAPSLHISATSPNIVASEYGVDGNRNVGLPKIVSREKRVLQYGGDTNIVIHPGSYIDVDCISVPDSHFEAGGTLFIAVCVYAIDMPVYEIKLLLNSIREE